MHAPIQKCREARFLNTYSINTVAGCVYGTCKRNEDQKSTEPRTFCGSLNVGDRNGKDSTVHSTACELLALRCPCARLAHDRPKLLAIGQPYDFAQAYMRYCFSLSTTCIDVRIIVRFCHEDSVTNGNPIVNEK